MTEWTSTEYLLPKHQEIVLCCDNISGIISLGQYDEDEDVFNLMNIKNIESDSYPTHWMPLPTLPELIDD